ncbi:hypothetical protein [Stenomitos frigidus]|uniref:Uncharacterized protein n=1 Tax=Stenomitos frigidus ULC18 TaxID=2107698 RepID=A0A2T1ENL5_9CYAN|nr:hypothetical protein [Stenomitos frigidus]PSB34337.1 hypothetical protein C7B82_02380 [Stenomitos frigidus ULC18]
MPPSEPSTSPVSTSTKPLVAPELLLSLATVPLLVALVGSKVLTEAVQELGLLSEEIFRGDRLPVLNFPKTVQSNPDNSTSV